MCYSCMYISKNLGKFLRYDISPECHCLYPCAKQLFFCCLPCVLLLLPHAWKALIVIFSFTHERSQVGSVGGALCRGWAELGAAPASVSGAFCLPCLSLSCVCVLIGRVPLFQQTRAPGEAVGGCSLLAGNIQTAAAWSKEMCKINPNKLRAEEKVFSPSPPNFTTILPKTSGWLCHVLHTYLSILSGAEPVILRMSWDIREMCTVSWKRARSQEGPRDCIAGLNMSLIRLFSVLIIKFL